MRRWLAAAALVLWPGVAFAHLAVTGLGPVYDGLYHFALSPRQGLPLAAFALFAGLRGPAQARTAWLGLPAGWAVGCLCGPGVAVAPLVSGCLLLAGGLLAAAPALGPRWVGVVAAGLGFALGYAYDAPPGLACFLGGFSVVLVLVPLVASVSLPLRRLQALIAVRVAGSWTAALGLLMLGWWMHEAGL